MQPLSPVVCHGNELYNTNSPSTRPDCRSHTCTCAGYASHSYYSRAVFISLKASDFAATNRYFAHSFSCYCASLAQKEKQSVMLGEIAVILGRHSLKLPAVLAELCCQPVMFGVGLGMHLVNLQTVSGEFELFLQHPEPSCSELAEHLEEPVDYPRILELLDTCWPSSPLFCCLTLADSCQLHPPEPTLEWEDHHLMKGSPLTLRGESR